MVILTIPEFWTAIAVLINNYHAINRKLCACIIDKVVAKTKGSQEKVVQTVEKTELTQHLQNVIRGKENKYDSFILFFRCLSKKEGQEVSNATALLDFNKISFRLTFECDHMDDFEVSLKDDKHLAIELTKAKSQDVESNYRWAEYVLKPKLLKWSRVDESNVTLETLLSNDNGSLRLVNIEKYNRLYKEFKIKYSEKALKLWTEANESTDPLKFIYEDLAIAAYLITLWENNHPRAFADLGCGNGLLVYILFEEGFKGFGYDIRARKIWSLYPSKVSQNLIEHPIEPLKFQLPSEVDWLIGNHSDELSPWLPVMAATAHHYMCYFLLPCCAYEFSGNKFQRRNSKVSAYKDFCDYVETISERCGFITEKDRLKIPSTKRIAFVGRTRKHSVSVHCQVVNEIKDFVNNDQLMYSKSNQGEIKLRNKVESVRNCTQIEKSIIDQLVMKIFLLLLNNSHESSNEWQCGRSLRMAEIVQNLHREDLLQIKSECGGLKTLLRNKHEIFELYKPDFVKIRKPDIRIPRNGTDKPQTIKKRQCFFFENHPQGCPLNEEQCTFVH